MAATSAAYADYSQMTAASQAGMPPAAAPGAQPRLEAPAATDYSAYGEKQCTFTCAVCTIYNFHSRVRLTREWKQTEITQLKYYNSPVCTVLLSICIKL